MKKKSKQAVVKVAKQKVADVAEPTPKERDGRLPAVGTVITKTYHGQTIEVKVLEIGFEYQRQNLQKHIPCGDEYRQTAYQRICILWIVQMMPRVLPPVKHRFVKGRSGNPLGRPKKLREEELLQAAIKFFDELAKAYYFKGNSAHKINRIRKVLNEK